MAEEAQLQEQMMKKMQEFEQMQKKMEILRRSRKLYEYKGPQLQIKLQISDKIFMSSTKVLCNKENGNNLFIRQMLGSNEDDEEVKMDNDEGKNNKNILNKAQKNGECMELYFDRDPELFHIILKHLRGYNMEYVLNNCSVTELQSLLDDAVYYNIKAFIKEINDCIHKRFDPMFCSPLIHLSSNGMVATRNEKQDNLHHGCGVYGILRKGKRYVEFQIMSHGNRYIMFGVTEGDHYSLTPFPGYRCSGCSYYASNGNLYRKNGNEGWGGALSYGDKCGILVDISDDQNTATVAWYINGKIVKQPINLKQYMDVTKGVVFVANLYANTEQVVIVQSPIVPQ